MTTEEYEIIVRGETFILDKYQILFDSPNYFSSYFLGDFKEAAEGQRQLILRRDPFLFKLVEAYLSGYPVLPLPTSLPAHMSPETAIKSLLCDAQFYGLDGLIQILQPPPKTVYRILCQSPGNGLTQLNLSREGVQRYLDSYKNDPNVVLYSYPASALGWIPSEGWELNGIFYRVGGGGYHLVEERVQ